MVRTGRFAGSSPGSRLLYVLLGAILCYVCLLVAGSADLAMRRSLLRYWILLSAAVFAVAAPHVLLPDPAAGFRQLLNPSPPALLRRQLRRWSRVVAVFALPCLFLAGYAPGRFTENLGQRGLFLLEALSVVIGLGGYSFALYLSIGSRSQAWQEGTAGGWYRALTHDSPVGFAVPDGLVPALLVTQRIFAVGILFAVAGTYADRLAAGTGWLPGLLLLGWVGVRLMRLRTSFDRHFYCTNAFYGELFSSGGVRAGEPRPLPYAGVYWSPRRWRPHVWAGLQQLDRRLPLGRFLVLGYLLLWIFFFQQASPNVITAYLFLLITAKNGSVFALTTEALSAPSFHLWLQEPSHWAVARFFVNLRWTLLFVFTLATVAVFDAQFSWGSVLLWTVVDMALAGLTAALATYLEEGTYRTRHA